MQQLTKKTTILFSPDLYRQLAEIAHTLHVSVAQLVRQAVVDRYILSDKKRRTQAVKELSEVYGPVSDWKTMEEEVVEGKIQDIL